LPGRQGYDYLAGSAKMKLLPRHLLDRAGVATQVLDSPRKVVIFVFQLVNLLIQLLNLVKLRPTRYITCISDDFIY